MKPLLPLTLCSVVLTLGVNAANKPEETKAEDPKAALAQQLQAAGVRSAAVEMAASELSLSVSGQVLDPAVLGSQVQEWLTAKVAAEVAQDALLRLKKLQAIGEVSAQLFQTTEADAKKALLALEIAQQKLWSNWGLEIAGHKDIGTLLQRLARGELALVRLDLPLGTTPQPFPVATVSSIYNPQQTQKASYLGLAPTASSITQGPALFYLIEKPQATLRAGAVVDGIISLSQPSQTLPFVADKALVRAGGKTFVYRETGEVSPHHERCPLKLVQRTTWHGEEGWLVEGKIKAGDKIVVQGAFTLLAWETLENEDGGEKTEEPAKPASGTAAPEKTK